MLPEPSGRSRPGTWSRSQRTVLLLILALAAVLRVSAMHGRPLFGDEVRIAVALEQSYEHLRTTFGGAITQPAFLLAAKFSRETLGEWLGLEAALRLPALIPGVAGILVIARLGRRVCGPRVGLWAAFALAVAPFHVFYSQMATAYALVATATMLSTDALLSLTRSLRAGPGRAARTALAASGYVLWTMLALYAHLGAMGIVIGQLASLPFMLRTPGGGSEAVRNRGRLLRNVLIAGSVVGLGSALGLLLYLPVRESLTEFRSEFTQGGFDLEFVPLWLTALAGGRGLSVYALLVLVVLGSAAAWRCARLGEFLGVTLMLPLGVLAFYWLNDSSHKPWAHARFFFAALPGMLIAAAAAVSVQGGTAANAKRAGVVTRAAVILAGSLLLCSLVAQSARIAWGPKDLHGRDLVEHVEAHLGSGALVIYFSVRQGSLQFYAGSDASAGFELLRFQTLQGKLASTKFSRPLLFAADLAAFEGAEWDAGWEVRRLGTTTLLWRERGGSEKKPRGLRDVLTVTDRMLDYLEQPTLGHDRDWVYWRLSEGHQHLFDREASLAEYRAFRDALRRELPRTPGRPIVPVPLEPDYWDMLGPHADFLPGGCPFEPCARSGT